MTHAATHDQPQRRHTDRGKGPTTKRARARLPLTSNERVGCHAATPSFVGGREQGASVEEYSHAVTRISTRMAFIRDDTAALRDDYIPAVAVSAESGPLEIRRFERIEVCRVTKQSKDLFSAKTGTSARVDSGNLDHLWPIRSPAQLQLGPELAPWRYSGSRRRPSAPRCLPVGMPVGGMMKPDEHCLLATVPPVPSRKLGTEYSGHLCCCEHNHPLCEPPLCAAARKSDLCLVHAGGLRRDTQFTLPRRSWKDVVRLTGERSLEILPQLPDVDTHLVLGRADDCGLQFELDRLSWTTRQCLWTPTSSPSAGHHNAALDR